jgi:hypothetical protein
MAAKTGDRQTPWGLAIQIVWQNFYHSICLNYFALARHTFGRKISQMKHSVAFQRRCLDCLE